MTRKRIAGSAAIILVVLAGLGYHLIFGYIDATQVDNHITVLTRKNLLNQIGANVVVYNDDQGAIVVDTQLPPLASSTRSNVDMLTTRSVANVFITHWHPDHSGGISAFSGNADVIAHDNVQQRLSAPQEGFGLTKPGSHHKFQARDGDGLPTRTVADRFELSTASTTISAIHYPMAHTDGDLVVFFHDSQVAVIGDLIWPESFPYVDVHNGGTVAGLESALQALLDESRPDYRFIPGHGAPLTFEDVSAYLEMVSQTRQWVEARLEEGQSLDQMVVLGLPEEWSRWSSPLVPATSWIKTVHATRTPSTSPR